MKSRIINLFPNSKISKIILLFSVISLVCIVFSDLIYGEEKAGIREEKAETTGKNSISPAQDFGASPDFPQFTIPNHEKEMKSLQDLFLLHYPGAGPKSTLWDEWLVGPSLWPAVKNDNQMNIFRDQWNESLSSRIIDSEGYVATHQHQSIAHQAGWPFPAWNVGSPGAAGWHFSFENSVGEPFRGSALSDSKSWILEGAEDNGIDHEGWKIKLTDTFASIKPPLDSFTVDTYQAPFMQIRWKSVNLGGKQPYIEWITKANPEYSPKRRMYFEPVNSDKIVYTMIPLYKHPEWKGKGINQFRICFGNTNKNVDITIQAFFTQYDTRHNINSQSFVTGCANYFWWTGDLDFLRRNINRMRIAMRYMITEHKALEKKAVFTNWVGHEGRSGLQPQGEGKRNILLAGNGIGGNYWDLLPFGYLDCYATLRYYGALKVFEKIEREIEQHPQWNIPEGIFKQSPDFLSEHAEEIKMEGNKIFWNSKTERFAAAVDIDGKKPDYGFTFINLEAIYYDFASPDHAEKIMQWIDGERVVKGDTSQGRDIYHWRFAPRATTKRNVEYYAWVWSDPQSIPFGNQVQDGGAVLGFSYHDLTARLKTKGADNAWERLKEIIKWFDEVQAEGGYRKYYDGKRDGTMQGAGVAGGLGLDNEFFESVMVPQIMLDGFLGFMPAGDGFIINPRLPEECPELTIDKIYFKNIILKIKVTQTSIEINKEEGKIIEPLVIQIPEGNWNIKYVDESGAVKNSAKLEINEKQKSFIAAWDNYSTIKLEKAD